MASHPSVRIQRAIMHTVMSLSEQRRLLAALTTSALRDDQGHQEPTWGTVEEVSVYSVKVSQNFDWSCCFLSGCELSTRASLNSGDKVHVVFRWCGYFSLSSDLHRFSLCVKTLFERALNHLPAPSWLLTALCLHSASPIDFQDVFLLTLLRNTSSPPFV